MAKFQDVNAEGILQRGPGKPQNCSAMAFSSTAVFLTWTSPISTGNNNPGNYWVHYRPLYYKGNFTVHRVGKQLFYLVENLDMVTYYAFRIVADDNKGNQVYCEVLAKTLRDATLSVPVRVRMGTTPAGGRGLLVTWKAVKVPDDEPEYHLFIEWRDKGKVNVELLYEGNETSAVIKRTLPVPHRIYVSVVVKRKQFEHLAGNIMTYPTKQALIPGSHITSGKPVTTNSRNKTLVLRISIDAYDWNFARVSWNTVETGMSHVVYRIIYKAGNDVIDQLTSNTSVALSGLNQLTTYTITVKALGNNGTLPPLSTEAHLSTLDKDECFDSSHTCSEHSECVNTRGSYFCRCFSGWTGDGRACKELPQNSGNLSHCDKNNFANVTWLTTLQGQTALAPCPAKSRGIAKRKCLHLLEGGASWGIPDLSECVSDEMAEIVQQFQDPSADVTDIARQLADVTAIVTHAQTPLQTGDLKVAVDIIEEISQRGFDNVQNYPPPLRGEKVRKIAQAVVKSSSNILDNNTLESWTFMPKDSISAEANKLLKGMDAVALHLAKTKDSSDSLLSDTPNVVLSVKSTKKSAENDQRLPPRVNNTDKVSSSVLLPGSVVKLQREGESQSETQFMTFVSYRNLRALMQPSNSIKSSEPTEGGSDVGRIESDVVSVTLHPMSFNSFEEPVTLILKNAEHNEEDQASCVFWNTNGTRGFWSGEGCHMTHRNKSHTTCQCYHLTSFAVLMRVKDVHKNPVMELHSYVLGLISYIGISISIVALCLSFFTFVFLRFRNTRQRYFVHANLALSLGLAETLFLFGINKTAEKIICKTIAITLHYLFLVSFCWMALEGVILYLMLVKIFRSKTRPGREKAVFLLCGWGIPAIIVAGSAVLFHEGYGTKDFCWLSFERHFTWAFVGPVLLVCLFNFICLGKTFMVMSSRGSTKKSDTSIQKIRYWSKGCALLSCLLGLTWIVGVFVVNEDTIFMAYLFNIFNTLQGLLIFLFHCIGDDKVRAEYLRIIRCQSRSTAYGAGRPWWSKSESISRSRTWEKIPRSTLQSNLETPKGTIDSSLHQRATLLSGAEYIALRQSLNRPVKVSTMDRITEDDCQQGNEELEGQAGPRPTSPASESLIGGTSIHENNGITPIKVSEEPAAATEPVETSYTCSCEHSSQSNLPDVIQNDSQADLIRTPEALQCEGTLIRQNTIE